MHEKKNKTSGNFWKENKSGHVKGDKRVWRKAYMKWKQNHEGICSDVEGRRKQKWNDVCCALYVTALEAGVL
jgi:hypothetical protein